MKLCGRASVVRWDQMESNIKKAEAQAAELERRTRTPDLQADHKELLEICRQLDAANAGIASMYERWAVLEAKRK